jgi:hypothetical protein
VRFRLWIGASVHGIKFAGARRRGLGAWTYDPMDLPKEVRDFLRLVKLNGNWVCAKIFTLKDACNANRVNAVQGDPCKLNFYVREKKRYTDKYRQSRIKLMAKELLAEEIADVN